MLNLAIVGLGVWGQRLVDAVQGEGRNSSGTLRFKRAAVRNSGRSLPFCERHGLDAGSYNEILADATVDAVVLATPHSVHYEQVMLAASAGKHIFVEKPMTLTKTQAKDSVDLCRTAGVVLAVGHNRRFLPAVQKLRAMIANGELGTLLHVEGNFSGAFGLGYRPGMWKASNRDSPAGGLTGMGIHLIDAFIHLCGPIESVAAQSQRRAVEVDMDDTTTVLCRFKNGMTGYFTTMMATPWIWRLQVFGTRGWVHMPDDRTLDIRRLQSADARYVDDPLQTLTFDRTDTERAELEAFAAAISAHKPYPVPNPEVVHGIAVMEAIVEACDVAKAASPTSPLSAVATHVVN